MFNINVAIIFSLLLSGNSCKQSSPANDPPLGDAVLQTTVITTALNQPWDLVWGPDGKLWMTERGGKVSRVDTGTGSVNPGFRYFRCTINGRRRLAGDGASPEFFCNSTCFCCL